MFRLLKAAYSKKEKKELNIREGTYKCRDSIPSHHRTTVCLDNDSITINNNYKSIIIRGTLLYYRSVHLLHLPASVGLHPPVHYPRPQDFLAWVTTACNWLRDLDIISRRLSQLRN